jgi:hypothetical protein
LKEVDLGGGESVYCINQVQIKKAFEMANHDPESGPRIQDMIDSIESNLSKNEQAALSFVLIERLLKS